MTQELRRYKVTTKTYLPFCLKCFLFSFFYCWKIFEEKMLYLLFLFQRLTIWAKCPMYLGKFPFDSQSCNLDIGKYLPTNFQKPENPFSFKGTVPRDFQLQAFSLISFP
jgi:hypothetical protein